MVYMLMKVMIMFHLFCPHHSADNTNSFRDLVKEKLSPEELKVLKEWSAEVKEGMAELRAQESVDAKQKLIDAQKSMNALGKKAAELGMDNLGIIGYRDNLKNLEFGQKDIKQPSSGDWLSGNGICPELVKENCRYDPDMKSHKNDAGSDYFVLNTLNQCNRDYCLTFCLKVGMATCSVELNNKLEDKETIFAPIGEDPSIKAALCAPIVARMCVVGKCCERNDPFLHAWVEDKIYGNNILTPILPHPICTQDRAFQEEIDPETGIKPTLQVSNACLICRKGVTLTFANKYAGYGVCTSLGSYASSTLKKGMEKQGSIDPQIGGKPRGGIWKDTGTLFRGTREKCDKFVDTAIKKGFWSSWNAKISGDNGMNPAFKVCQCLGCCRKYSPADGKDTDEYSNSCYFNFYGDDTKLAKHLYKEQDSFPSGQFGRGDRPKIPRKDNFLGEGARK